MNSTNGHRWLHAYNAMLLTDIIRRALLPASQGEQPEHASAPDAAAPSRHRQIYGNPVPDHPSRERNSPGAAR